MIVIITLMAAETLPQWVSMRSKRASSILDDVPVLPVEDGNVQSDPASSTAG